MKFNLHVVNEFKRPRLMTSFVSKPFLTLHSLFADDDVITSTSSFRAISLRTTQAKISEMECGKQDGRNKGRVSMNANRSK